MIKSIILLFLAVNMIQCQEEPYSKFFPSLEYPDSMQVVTRKAWDSKGFVDTLKYHQIIKITIHHGGVEYDSTKNSMDYIRHMQEWSRNEKGWIDTPYHFMIDFHGRIFETRPLQFPGDTNTDYDVRGHALICVIGNFEVQEVNRLQLKSLTNLTRFLKEKYNVALKDIKTHKDYTETKCPGKNLYNFFENGTIQKRIKNL